MSKLEKRLTKLEETVAKLRTIGEISNAYTPNAWGYTGCYWNKFTEKDVTDRVNGCIKINEIWYSLDEVILYRDENRIRNLKRKIEKNKEEKK